MLPQSFRRVERIWLVAFAVIFAVQSTMMIRHQKGLYSQSQWMVPLPAEIFAVASPNNPGGNIAFTAMTIDGWISASQATSSSPRTSGHDRISQFSSADTAWIEVARANSNIYVENHARLSAAPLVRNAEQPIATVGGQRLAFLRRNKGRGSLWTVASSGIEVRVVPESFDVLEMTFAPNGQLIFAASPNSVPALFSIDGNGLVTPMGITHARFPSVSSDGNLLAYSRRSNGVWNLWIRNLRTREERRITSADCNDLSPTWEPNSRTLDYTSDCGRGLWLTALYRRDVASLAFPIER